MEPANKPPNGFVGHEARKACLNSDVWYLIMQMVDDSMYLRTLCLVSKNFYSLAVPHLYRTILIGSANSEYFTRRRMNKPCAEPCAAEWEGFCSLVDQLVQNPNGQAAHAVRVVELYEFLDDEEPIEDDLVSLLKVLPNLRQFRIHRTTTPDFLTLARALHDHPNKPQIHLTSENGSSAVVGSMPSVATLDAWVQPRYQADEPDEMILRVQEVLFACPNLTSFSFTDYKPLSIAGRVFIPRDGLPPVRHFRLTRNETWPPLESLSLNGYCPTPEEWIHWEQGINWPKVRSLSIGPQGGQPSRDLLDFLRRSRVHAGSLRSLTVRTWDNDHKPGVGKFLTSFDSLEQLTVKGQVVQCSFAVCNHPKLKRLCLHSLELPKPNGTTGERGRRSTLNVADLRELARRCPELKELEIDIHRGKRGWPRDIMVILASAFANLRHLTLHCEVGIDWDNPQSHWPSHGRRSGNQTPVAPLLLPIIDEDMARTFGEAFFAIAARRGSKLETLMLKTGEDLRRIPGLWPEYMRHEYLATVDWLMRARSCPCGGVSVTNLKA